MSSSFTGKSTSEALSMARVVKGFHSFSSTPTRLSGKGMNHAFVFPAESGPHYTDPGGMEGGVAI